MKKYVVVVVLVFLLAFISTGPPAHAAQYDANGNPVFYSHTTIYAAQLNKLASNVKASGVADSGAINTAETLLIKTSALAANRLTAGQVIRITLEGTCTSTAADASTFAVRLGTAGTTSDALILTGATSVAATSGTAVPFHAEILLTIRTTGASATCVGKLTLINTGVTGISAVNSQVVTLTPSTFNSATANLILSATYKSAASTTTSTFNQAVIEMAYL